MPAAEIDDVRRMRLEERDPAQHAVEPGELRGRVDVLHKAVNQRRHEVGAADRHHLPTVDDRSSHALSSATAHLSGGSIRLPAADDHSFREVSSALGHWLAGSSWQSLAARVRGRFGFPALPRSAYCFLAAAKNYSPRDHSWTGWNSASPKAAGCAKVRFAASSFLNCLAHCPHDSQNYH